MKDIEVIFHHFENDDEKKQMNYVYRLIEKGYKKRFGNIYVHASTEAVSYTHLTLPTKA